MHVAGPKLSLACGALPVHERETVADIKAAQVVQD
jgi:hypothetical protein